MGRDTLIEEEAEYYIQLALINDELRVIYGGQDDKIEFDKLLDMLYIAYVNLQKEVYPETTTTAH